MQSIKVWMVSMEGLKCPTVVAGTAIEFLDRIRQNRHEPHTDYRRHFSGTVEVLEHINIELGKVLKRCLLSLFLSKRTICAA